MKSKYLSFTNILVILIVSLPVIVYAAVENFQSNDQLPFLNGARNLSSAQYQFIDQDKKNKNFLEYKNKILLVDFFFTSCPVICPKMTRALTLAAKKFNTDSTIKILSFTVDPQRDSSAKLLKYAQKMNAVYSNWDFLTGDKVAIYKLARKEFFVTATEGDGGPGDFIHTDKIILLDKNDSIRGYYEGTNETEILQLIKDVKKLKNEN